MATLDTGAARTNFAHLEAHDEQLVRLGMLAERYFAEDPNTALLKLRQLAGLLAQLVATKVGLYTSREEAQYDLLRRLQDQGILPRAVAQLFGEVRRAGNAANHAIVGDHRTALAVLKITWQLGIWFHRTFTNAAFKSGPFVPPSPPKNESDELRAELAALGKALADHQAAHHEAAAQLASTEAKLRDAKDEQAFWQQMAVEAEQAKTALAQKLAAEQAEGALRPKAAVTAFVTAATTAASVVELDEADTRKLIDEHLAKSRYPFAAANLRNLVPMGHKCNSNYKLAVDVLYDASGVRRVAFDPYNHTKIGVVLDDSDPFDGSMPNTHRWTIKFDPDAPAVPTWDAVFSIRERHERDHLDEGYSAWLREFRNWARSSDRRGDTDASLVEALTRFELYCAGNGMRDKAFLKAEVFRMLRLRCEQGHDRLKEQLRDLMAPPATASATAASAASEAAA